MKSVKYLILGGGISGLSAAVNLKEKDFVVLEEAKHLGGLCKTHYVGDFIWDYAGHFFHFSTEEWKEYFHQRINRTDIRRVKKNTKIWYKGKLVSYPFQMNIHQLDTPEFIECLYELYFKESKDEYDNFEKMLYGKFGKGITEKFLKPYNEKLYACPLKDLDKDAMGRFFPYADLGDIIKNMRWNDHASYNSYFEYPKRGSQQFIDALALEIPGEKIQCNTAVTSIDIHRKIAVADSGEYQYEFLISTVPLNRLLKLCGMQGCGGRLSSNKVLVFNIGFNRDAEEEVKGIHWIYFPGEETVFYRVGFYNHILSMEKASLYVEIGLKADEEIGLEKTSALYGQALEGLKKCGIIGSQNVEAYESIVMDPAYVHITKEGIENRKHLLRKLENEGIFCIGRYGAWTYCSIEDCLVQAKETALRISGMEMKEKG